MLSFLREQGGVDVPSRKPDVAGGKTSRDGTEQPREEQYLTVAAHQGRTRRSTILLAVLFIIGLLCLGFMIKKSTPKAALATTVDTEETQIEAALARLTGAKTEMFSRMDEIVRKFYEFSNVLQVQVSELLKNPFTLELLMAGVKEEPDVKETPTVDAAMVWRQEVQRKAADMQLLSIMQSDQGTCCMIADKILCKGDSIDGFEIREIGSDFVKLEWSPERHDRPAGTESDRVDVVLRLPK
jgi:hypothetical protein